ncbi:MAG: hypothetical protein KAH10_04815 [Flavobacteriales bacterium]|nr:hypothetical protein [Flavobacteriales bacterium]
MISKFLLAENPVGENTSQEFILHTQSPRLLAEVIEGKLGYRFEVVQQYDTEDISDVDIDELKLEMLDWWNEYLDWEEEIAEEEGE